MTLQSNDSLVKSVLQEEREIIFIDPTVEDYQSLIGGINPDTKLVILDRMKDGVSQITESLQGSKYKAVHIVSHGGEGSLQLGSKQLNSANLDFYKSQLEQWTNSLTEDADILLYGCDVAAGETGVGFVQQLSLLTGADVAASDNLTGSAALGGDWDLEVKTGKIESPLAFQSDQLQIYNYTLNTPPVIINEWSQGVSGSKEWVELLVTTTTDMRGWKLEDTLGLYTTFSNDSTWQAVAAGTIIVIYNSNDKDTILPASDDLSANGDYRIVVAHNNSTLFTPGSWRGFANAGTRQDNPILKNSSDTVIHDWDQSDNTAFTASSLRPGATQAVYYTGDTAAGVSIATNYTRIAASGTTSAVTPGTPNGANNTDWINILRGVVKVVNTPAVRINNPSPAIGELFGFSLASSSSNILIGAPKADGNKGEAYGFGINALFQQTFTNPSSGTAEQFGFAVATNGTNYLVGASKWDDLVPDVGIAYQFNASGVKQQTFNNSVNNDDSEFGSAIAILKNGNYVISAPEKDKTLLSLPIANAGQVRLFSSNGTLLKNIDNPETTLTTVLQNARFGFSVAAADNNIFIGSPGFTSGLSLITGFGFGKAYLYNISSDSFKYFTNPNASLQDFFGFSVASNSDGTRFLVGAPGETIGGTAGIAYLFDNNSTLLRTFSNSDTTNKGFGASVAFIGNDILVGSPGGFTFNSGTFAPSPNRGAVYLYDGDGTTPTYNLDRIFANPNTSDDGFGSAISVINNHRIAISAPYYDAGSNIDAGIAYIFNINNTPPTASNKTVTTNEDTTYTLNATDFNFGDADGDNLQKVQVTSLLRSGSLTLNGTAVTANQEISIADITGGKFKFTPVADGSGSNYASFGFKVNDGVDFSTSTYAMTIAVNPVNDAPVVEASKTITLNEDASNTALNITAPTDVDGDTLTITVTGLPDAIKGKVYLADGVTQVNNNQILTAAQLTGLVFSPVADANGIAGSFSYSVSDGTVNSSQTITLNINPVNDRPTFTIGNNQSVKTGVTQAIVGWASGFSSGATNETQSVAGYIVNVVNNVNADIFDVAPTINLAGDLIYTAKSGITASKTATIQVKVQDNGGTLNGGVDTSAPQTFTITVNPTATNSINGTPNPDNLMGTDQSDRISGLDSDDIVYGGLGSDRIFGNNGNDILYGDLGIKSDNSDIKPAYGPTFSMNDTIAGGAGNDKIYGNLGNDKLYGDEGDDVIWGGDGDDEIWGGYGNDTLYGGAGKDAFVLVRGQGADIIMDFKSEDVLGCAGALTYSSLLFEQKNGDTLITDKGTSELLATLKGFIGTPNIGGLF